MKRWAWVMLLAATTAPGCVTVPNKIEEPQPPVAMKESPRPPITPEEVNENNARDSFERLSEEVERQQTAALPGQQ